MVNFIDSFKQGLSAAEQAVANLEEIEGVIQTLSDQLQQATGGKIKVSISEKVNPFKSLFDMTPLVPKEKPPLATTQWAIVAYNPTAVYQPKSLAEWKYDENGYPCRVTIGSEQIYCEDKQALEKALVQLLASSDTGKKLRAVMEQPSKS